MIGDGGNNWVLGFRHSQGRIYGLGITKGNLGFRHNQGKLFLRVCLIPKKQ